MRLCGDQVTVTLLLCGDQVIVTLLLCSDQVIVTLLLCSDQVIVTLLLWMHTVSKFFHILLVLFCIMAYTWFYVLYASV